MNIVEAQPISGDRVLIQIKTGEYIQAEAAIPIDRARELYRKLGEAIDAKQGYPDEEDNE